MAKYLFPLSVALLVLGQAVELRAQIFNSEPSQSSPTAQQVGVQQAGATIEEPASSGWAGIPLPKLTLPKLTLPSMTAITAPMKSGVSKVTAGTKKAWQGTKEIFSFGPKKTPTRRRSSQQEKPSFWRRMLVREQEYKIPQTVGEFMSQPRLDP